MLSLEDAIIILGQDMFAMKLYWVAVSALWFYDYILTLPEEINHGWKGKKSPVFILYFLNRYLPFVFILLTLIAYFLNSFDLETCSRYGFMESLETALLTTVAEIFLTLRIFALSGAKKFVVYGGSLIMVVQWIIVIYGLSQTSKGSDQVAILLPLPPPPPPGTPLPPLPPLPDIDPYHICIFISTLALAPVVEAYLCLSLAFDCLAFLAICYLTRDGIIYFFVLFSSNLTWVLLLLYARPSLKFIHNQPAMIISAIMINRITINLKTASHQALHSSAGTSGSTTDWSVQTFKGTERRHGNASQQSTLAGSSYNDIEMNPVLVIKSAHRHGAST